MYVCEIKMARVATVCNHDYVSEQTADIVASERDEWKVQIPIRVLTMRSAGQR